MTLEEFDSRVRNGEAHSWILDVPTGMSYMWTGWKRKYDSRLMTQAYEIIDDGGAAKRVPMPHEPIDDTLVGQWIGQRGNPIFYYASVPGGAAIARQGELLDVEVRPDQTALTINSSPDLLEHCRKEGFSRLIVTMEKMGAIEGPNSPMA